MPNLRIFGERLNPMYIKPSRPTASLTGQLFLFFSLFHLPFLMAQSSNQMAKTKGEILVLDEQLKKVINTEASMEILGEGFSWSEGPLWLEEQDQLIFSDIPENKVYAWKEGHEIKVYLSPSGFTGKDFQGSEPGANGLTLDPKGRLILCQHGNRAVSLMDAPLDKPKAKFKPLASTYKGQRLNSPNDLVFDSKGNLYFTDPPYGLPNQMEDPEKEIDFQGIYRLSPEGELTLISDQLTRPNGLAFSPDEKTLYVANSDPEQAIWMAYELDASGAVISERLFFDATDMVATEKGLPDGLKVDDSGNLFATGPGGVLIFSPEGKHLGTLYTGEATANCAFNTDKSVLYITADGYLLRFKI